MNTENSEQSIKRDYSSLSEEEKIRAILGAVIEPVSKQFALDLSGIDYDRLNTEMKERINNLFDDDEVKKEIVDGDCKYILNELGRERLAGNIDMRSVHSIIADKLWGDLFPDDNLD